jgi:hypothetical protein
VTFLPAFPFSQNGSLKGKQAVKKSSRKQPQGDDSPFAFDRNDESVPFALPVDRKPPQRPPRRETRAKQQQLAKLRDLAALRQYLPKEERSKVIVLYASSGRLVALDPIPDHDPRVLAAFGVRDWWAKQESIQRPRALSIGAQAISQAAADLRDEYNRVTNEACDGIEAGDQSPLIKHIFLWGFELFDDSGIMEYVQNLWLGAKNSNAESARRLEEVLGALRVGRGNLGKKTEEQRKEDDQEYQRTRRARNRNAYTKLCQELKKATNRPLKARESVTAHKQAIKQDVTAIIARYANSPDAAERTAAKKKIQERS